MSLKMKVKPVSHHGGRVKGGAFNASPLLFASLIPIYVYTFYIVDTYMYTKPNYSFGFCKLL